ncbi:MAG: bifunctional folylpolyglutamate synthase/dihydrofolate synthase [Firmicutes bacterium]|nr:bifunctional folylpolyglutamate synthase/dihydrofolate synthase [Bacillota bacterium]
MNWEQVLAWLESLGQFGARPGLERINRVLDALGRPEKKLNIIHIAGTNGKGSVAAFISSILTAAGYRTGLYTSPHLVRYTERFLLDGTEADQCELARHFSLIRDVVARLQTESNLILTEFEVLTVAACLYFAAQKVDYLVLEAGLGGRLDATNVVDPSLAVITRIGLDHLDVLGNTLVSIANEKAGIIKPGVATVLGAQETEVTAAICNQAQQKKAKLYFAPELVSAYPKEISLTGQRFDLQIADLPRQRNLQIKLLGPHQLENVATAACAWYALLKQGVTISETAFSQGLATAFWPARFEVISTDPVTIIIDGGHNYSAARALARTVKQYLPMEKVLLVIGLLGDKDVDGILKVLAPLAAKAVATRPNSPRALNPEEVARKLESLKVESLVEPDIEAAVNRALSMAKPGDTVLVCGSLYLVGRVRERLQHN